MQFNFVDSPTLSSKVIYLVQQNFNHRISFKINLIK